jgi:hypothetical protein
MNKRRRYLSPTTLIIMDHADYFLVLGPLLFDAALRMFAFFLSPRVTAVTLALDFDLDLDLDLDFDFDLDLDFAFDAALPEDLDFFADDFAFDFDFSLVGFSFLIFFVVFFVLFVGAGFFRDFPFSGLAKESLSRNAA